MTKIDYETLGREIGALITNKQKAYGDSFHKSGEVISQLFPNGIQKENYTDVLAIIRIVDKLFRVATDPNWGGESPWKDIAGYALLRLGDVESRNSGETNKIPISRIDDSATDLEWLNTANLRGSGADLRDSGIG